MDYGLATQARELMTDRTHPERAAGTACVEILAFSPGGSTLARPYCRNEHYWQVYFDTNRAISRLFTPVRIG